MNFKKNLNQHRKFYLDKDLDKTIKKYLYDSYKGEEYEIFILYDFVIHKFVFINNSIGYYGKGKVHDVFNFTILGNDENIINFEKYKKWAKKILENKMHVYSSILSYLEEENVTDIALYVRNEKLKILDKL